MSSLVSLLPVFTSSAEGNMAGRPLRPSPLSVCSSVTPWRLLLPPAGQPENRLQWHIAAASLQLQHTHTHRQRRRVFSVFSLNHFVWRSGSETRMMKMKMCCAYRWADQEHFIQKSNTETSSRYPASEHDEQTEGGTLHQSDPCLLFQSSIIRLYNKRLYSDTSVIHIYTQWNCQIIF